MEVRRKTGHFYHQQMLNILTRPKITNEMLLPLPEPERRPRDIVIVADSSRDVNWVAVIAFIKQKNS